MLTCYQFDREVKSAIYRDGVALTMGQLSDMLNCTTRLRCARCGKECSTPVPPETVVRAFIECPECLEADEDDLCPECGGAGDVASSRDFYADGCPVQQDCPVCGGKDFSARVLEAAKEADAAPGYVSKLTADLVPAFIGQLRKEKNHANRMYESAARLAVEATEGRDALLAAAQSVLDEMNGRYDGVYDGRNPWTARHIDALTDAIRTASAPQLIQASLLDTEAQP